MLKNNCFVQKKFFLVFFLALFCINSVAQYNPIQKDTERLKLHGKVKTCICDVKNSFDAHVIYVPTIFDSYHFDEKGYLTDSYNTTTHTVSKNVYDKKGRIIRIESENKYDKLNWLLIFEYNQRGNVIKEKYYTNGKLKTTIFIYDNNNRIIASQSYDKKGKPISKEILRYNQKGDIFHSINYYATEGIYYEYLNKYNEKGLLIQAFKSASPKETGKRNWRLENEFVYDENDELQKSTKYYLGNKSVTLYRKDTYGNKIREFEKELDVIPPTKEKIIEKTEFKYDNQGNWISKKVFENGKLMTKLVRNIEYYDEN